MNPITEATPTQLHPLREHLPKDYFKIMANLTESIMTLKGIVSEINIGKDIEKYNSLINPLLSSLSNAVKNLGLEQQNQVPITSTVKGITFTSIYSSFISLLTQFLPTQLSKILLLIASKNKDIYFSLDAYKPNQKDDLNYASISRASLWIDRSEYWNSESVKNLISRFRVFLEGDFSSETLPEHAIGLNSRIHPFFNLHLLQLDFDGNLTPPRLILNGEPGLWFRTTRGFHFQGFRVYSFEDWVERLRSFREHADKSFIKVSLMRGYSTLRLTRCTDKPMPPILFGHSYGRNE